MPAVIEVRNLHKSYGTTVAVDDVSFTVEEGEIFGILGPNGAGKTTTVECVEGLRTPDGGSIGVLGLDPRRDRAELTQQLGVQLQDSELPERLRVAEALRLSATHLHEIMPARIARKGSTRLLVPIADSRHLDALAPNPDTLLALGTELGADGFFVFAVNRSADELSTDSRMFCPALGIPEDPVSGNAHAMLASYLWDLGQFAKNSATFIGRQGRQMKRPGQVHVRLEVDQGTLVAAHIGGAAVIVSEGNLAL